VNGWEFLKHYVQAPARTGAVAASSEALAEMITGRARLADARCVVELGPGTGVFTEKILARIKAGTIFFAMEINPTFVEATRLRCPQATVIHDSPKRPGNISCNPIAGSATASSPACPGFFRACTAGPAAGSHPRCPGAGRPVSDVRLSAGTASAAGPAVSQETKAGISKGRDHPTVWKNLPPAFVYLAVR